MLSDERQILNLLHLYCELQDAADFTAVSELFRHSRYRAKGGQSLFGFEEVYALKTRHDKIHEDGTLRTKHVTTNTILEFAPDGRSAETRSYFTVYQATQSLPLQCVIAGRYHDRFEKVDGKWRFADRLILSDLRGNLTQHLRDNPLSANTAER
jgi:SnoaL-like domain